MRHVCACVCVRETEGESHHASVESHVWIHTSVECDTMRDTSQQTRVSVDTRLLSVIRWHTRVCWVVSRMWMRRQLICSKIFLESSGCRICPPKASGYQPRLTQMDANQTVIQFGVVGINQTNECLWGRNPAFKKFPGRRVSLNELCVSVSEIHITCLNQSCHRCACVEYTRHV